MKKELAWVASFLVKNGDELPKQMAVKVTGMTLTRALMEAQLTVRKAHPDWEIYVWDIGLANATDEDEIGMIGEDPIGMMEEDLEEIRHIVF